MSTDVVTRFHERMQARDWEGAAECLSPTISVWWPASRERFSGATFLKVQRDYPEGWAITVHETVRSGAETDGRVAARVSVDLDGERYWCHGFYSVADGVIVDAIEAWVTEGAEPVPAWRAVYSDG